MSRPAGPARPDPALPPAVGTYRPASRDLARAAVFFVGVVLVFVLLKGAPLDDVGLWLQLGAIAGAGVLYLLWRNTRIEVTVGPGWLQARSAFRRRWVRTDRLVAIKDTAAGPADRLLHLRDADGRRTLVSYGDLVDNRKLYGRFLADLHTSVAAGLELPPSTQRLLIPGASRPRRRR